jgi:hypothetical protein
VEILAKEKEGRIMTEIVPWVIGGIVVVLSCNIMLFSIYLVVRFVKYVAYWLRLWDLSAPDEPTEAASDDGTPINQVMPNTEALRRTLRALMDAVKESGEFTEQQKSDIAKHLSTLINALDGPRKA